MLGKYINLNKIFYYILKFLKKSKIVIEKHKFLTFANLTSIFLGLFPCVYGLLRFEPQNKIPNLMYLIPIPVVYLVSLAAYFIFKKLPTISRIFSFLLNSTIIVIFQILFALIIFSFADSCDFNDKCNKVENYQVALQQYPTKRVAHFPDKIPPEATNIRISAETFSFFGSQSLYLVFDIDKQYIDNEIEKHSFVNIMDYAKASKFYGFYNNDIDFSKYTFYVINDREHENLPGHHFPYHYGIGVNKDSNQILYYYENPD